MAHRVVIVAVAQAARVRNLFAILPGAEWSLPRNVEPCAGISDALQASARQEFGNLRPSQCVEPAKDVLLRLRPRDTAAHRLYLSKNLRTASLTVSPLSSALCFAADHNLSGTRITRDFIGSLGMGQVYRVHRQTHRR